MRIAFLGASLTEGSYGGSYVNELRALLPDHELINAGVNGSTMNKLLARVESVLEQSPDALFVLAGSNDAIAYSQPRTRSYYKSLQGLPEGFLDVPAFASMYRDLLTQIQLAHVQALVGLPPMEYNVATAEASRLFNDAAREAARAFNAPVCDLYSAMMPDAITDRKPLDMGTVMIIGDRVKAGWNDYELEHLRGGYTYSFDGIHFTPQGAAQAAAIIAAFLKTELGI